MIEPDETDDGRVIAAVKEYMRLLDEGSAPSQDEFLQQHAEIADELRPSLEGLAMVHVAATPKPSPAIVVPGDDFTAKPVGDFRIVGELGRGGMGVVYEAIQMSLGRHVALKVLPFASGLDEVRLQRFRNEAHAAAALHHTNIVPVYAVGSDRGVHYYAMQMIDGSTLAELIQSTRESISGDSNLRSSKITSRPQESPDASSASLPDDTVGRYSTMINSGSADRQRYYKSVVRMIHQAADAIDHAHQYGVVHRDIKPANLLLDAAGKVWVTDFGLAQMQTEATHLTRTGDPMGTLRYMSPEQAAGDRDELDHRTDIYSLGVTLYELLTLQPAISGEGYREMLNNVALHDPPAPRSIAPDLPLELDTIVRKAIAKLPEERYKTAGALADDLQAWMDDKPILAKPPTTLQRLGKWRRRNSGLVAVISGFLLLATLGLLLTTLLIWKEQRQTRVALDRETEQRQRAQRSFQQARDAVEAFSQISETELAYRPDLQNLRRSFLETSLAFYQDFLRDQADNPALAKELENTSTRVASMLEELKILESISPLRALPDERVQRELGIDPDTAELVSMAVSDFNDQRQSMANQYVTGLQSENPEMTELVQSFDRFISSQLTDSQIERIRQIMRQERMPFTFKTSEVVKALGLTRQQREDINRIILEMSPKGPDSFGREGPGRGGPPRFGGPRGGGPRFGGDRFSGDRRSGPSHQDPPEFGRKRDGSVVLHFDRAVSPETQKTVQAIVEILTPEQRDRWKELIGEPFNPF